VPLFNPSSAPPPAVLTPTDPTLHGGDEEQGAKVAAAMQDLPYVPWNATRGCYKMLKKEGACCMVLGFPFFVLFAVAETLLLVVFLMFSVFMFPFWIMRWLIELMCCPSHHHSRSCLRFCTGWYKCSCLILLLIVQIIPQLLK